jgi:hypothetical protein
VADEKPIQIIVVRPAPHVRQADLDALERVRRLVMLDPLVKGLLAPRTIDGLQRELGLIQRLIRDSA